MFVMMMPKLICWNCRGFANKDTLNHIQELIKGNKSELVCLAEAYVDENQVLKFCANFKRS